MRGTVDTFLEMKSIDGDIFSYTGDGKNEMDKSNSLPQYSRDNQILTVERHFSDSITLHEVLKQCLSERWRKERFDTLGNRLYNGSGNTTAVASTKEGSIV